MSRDSRTTIHELKTEPAYYDAVECGLKNFEIRCDDRGFQRGDIVVLQRLCDNSTEIELDCRGNVRHQIRFRIGWILTGGQFGLESGYVVFSLEKFHQNRER